MMLVHERAVRHFENCSAFHVRVNRDERKCCVFEYNALAAVKTCRKAVGSAGKILGEHTDSTCGFLGNTVSTGNFCAVTVKRYLAAVCNSLKMKYIIKIFNRNINICKYFKVWKPEDGRSPRPRGSR